MLVAENCGPNTQAMGLGLEGEWFSSSIDERKKSRENCFLDIERVGVTQESKSKNEESATRLVTETIEKFIP